MAMNWQRVFTWLIAIAFLIGVVFFFREIFGSEPSVTELMMNTITLRSTNDTVQRAELVTDMDEMVKRLKNDAIRAQWLTLTSCIAGNACTQDDYFDFLLMIAIERKKEVPHADLIVNVITANRYWGNTEKLLEFSKALSVANDQIESLQIKPIANKWQEVVYCDGKCLNYHDLFFEFIRLLLSV